MKTVTIAALVGRLGALIMAALIGSLTPSTTRAQALDWQKEIWHEPQVRYLLIEMSLGGNVDETILVFCQHRRAGKQVRRQPSVPPGFLLLDY